MHESLVIHRLTNYQIKFLLTKNYQSESNSILAKWNDIKFIESLKIWKLFLFDLLATKQRWQIPLWHNCSHLCRPQFSILLQTCVHRWSLSLQQTSLHWCRPQVFFFWHRRWHRISWSWFLQSISSISFPHLQFTSILRSQGPHSPTWHLRSHKWTSSPRAVSTTWRSFWHVCPHVGTASAQLVLIILFLIKSSRIGVFPHGQTVSLEGISEQVSHGPEWQLSAHLWLLHDKSLSHLSSHLNQSLSVSSKIKFKKS